MLHPQVAMKLATEYIIRYKRTFITICPCQNYWKIIVHS